HIQDAQGRYLKLNPVTAAYLGYPIEAVLGRSDEALQSPHPEHAASRRSDREEVLAQRRTVEREARFLSADGRLRHAHVIRFPILLDPDQPPLGVGSFAIDISAQVEA